MTQTLAINAHPTKELFIHMLVRDISLVRAIIELVDNSVDGARRIRGSEGSLKGLQVSIKLDAARFEIEDNCGGIPPDTARQYAFRFGRPEGFPTTPGAVGNFGVGMKRALFKMGEQFMVTSRSDEGSFDLEVDVEAWSRTTEWEFEAAADPTPVPLEQTGTTIVVERLYTGVSDQFGLPALAGQLSLALEAAQQVSLARGLTIKLNDVDVPERASTLLSSDALQPAREVMQYPHSHSDGPPVAVHLIAGLGDSAPGDAGWYVYCNGRMILRADRTAATGWGHESLPQYHNQYSRFRGYAYFDCDDPGALPWNTTKTGVDEEHPIYRAVRLRMIDLARPVFDFLNRLKQEVDDDAPQQPLHDFLTSAKAERVQGLLISTTSAPFRLPISTGASAPRARTRSIQYSVALERLERAMEQLQATTLREVGERTFEYYYIRECQT